MILPPPLIRGSTIGIAAPSGVISDKSLFTKGIRVLHELGYNTKFPRNLWPGLDYLSDTDHSRVSELQNIWNDHEVDAVMAARGGYGCLRIGQAITGGTYAANPKIFIGYSDISLLHNLLNSHHRLVTFHGPVVTSLPKLSQESIQSFDNALRNKANTWEYRGDAEILQGDSIVKGVSTGGNLSTVISTLGTPLQPDWKDKIVFLEDTGEPTYRIDRMLTQLQLAGMFDTIVALILGDFSHGLGLDRTADMRHHEAIWKRAIEVVRNKTTVWANFPIGHGRLNHTIPFGLEITIDNTQKCMTTY
jgi:muramoyltetrapeptide carboxypeptidase